MIHARFSALSFGACLAASACTPTGDSNAQVDASKVEPPKPTPSDASPPPPPPAPEQPSEPSEVAPTETPPAVTPPEVPPPAEAIPIVPELVPIVPIASTPATAPWRTAASPSEALTLVDLDAGVLASGASGYQQIGEDGQLALFELEAPAAAVFGVWPKDAWTIEQRDKIGKDDRGNENTTELRLMRLRGGKRWVPQEFLGEQRFVDNGHDIRKSAHSGLLVYYDDALIRVASSTGDPERGEYLGSFVDHAETATGEIYPITRKGEFVYVQTDCEDQACVAENARQLPITGTWTFPRQVARQRHSVTLLAEVGERRFLLFYDAGGWKLEEPSAGSEPKGMWATKDGGLWTSTGDALRHRDPDGAWRDVGLPEGLSGLSVAITEDRSELWIAGDVGGSPAVFATHANAQEPAPAPAAEPPPG